MYNPFYIMKSEINEVIFMYITITGSDMFMGMEAFKVGQTLILKKDIDSPYDDESIKVLTETGASLGFVANSVDSVARGTHSAGYIYNSFEDSTNCKVLFITYDKVIAEVK